MYRYLPLLLLLFTACDGDTKSRKENRGENFVPDPNYIFFKNTRQRNYSLEEMGQKGNLFTQEDLLETEAALLPVIFDDWLNDRAYLQFKTRQPEAAPDLTRKTTLFITSETGENEVALPQRPTVAQVQQLLSHLKKERPIRVLVGTDTLAAFPGDASRYARVAMQDYLKLVDVR